MRSRQSFDQRWQSAANRGWRAVRRPVAGVLSVLVLSGVGLLGAAAPAAAAGRQLVRIGGIGSTWSSLAIDEWRANVTQFGMTVDYSARGSTVGRAEFARGTTYDFGVSEIPYAVKDEGAPSQLEAMPSIKFAYMPIVAGGTSFMYNLKISGRQVTNLRLSGETVAKIFTKKITMWNDPAIKADNPGLPGLPGRRIVPVVRSDGSGTTAQLTTWMRAQYPAIWNDWCAKNNRHTPCSVTSFYPTPNDPTMVGQQGSDGVSGYVASASGEGAITYVEYAYSKKSRLPVVKLLNKAGYYVEPTASNVAIGLQKADINPDLTQKLDGVYSNPDSRTYPLSSYSYMLVPTEVKGPITLDKGYTLAAFAKYFLCGGQGIADSLGYSPLPKNLVQRGLDVVKRIPGADPSSYSMASCKNPTIGPHGENLLAATAPQPPACDMKGATTQCSTGTGGLKDTTTTTAGGGGSRPGTTGPGGATPGASGAPSAAPGAVPGGATPVIDPDTGQPVGTAAGSGGAYVDGVPVALETEGGFGLRQTLMALSALMLGLLIVLPPMVGRYLRSREN